MDPMTIASLATGAVTAGTGVYQMIAGAKNKQRQTRRANDRFEQDAADYKGLGDKFGNMEASQMAGSSYEARQKAFADMMAQASAGNGPSQAQMQLRNATDQNVANQMAMAQSGRGSAQANMFNAARNTQALGAQAANQSAMLRQQEMMQARELEAQALSQFRGQDIDVAGRNLAADQLNRQLNQQGAFDAQGGVTGSRTNQTQFNMGQLQAQQQQAGALMAGGMSMVGNTLGSYQSQKHDIRMQQLKNAGSKDAALAGNGYDPYNALKKGINQRIGAQNQAASDAAMGYGAEEYNPTWDAVRGATPSWLQFMVNPGMGNL